MKSLGARQVYVPGEEPLAEEGVESDPGLHPCEGCSEAEVGSAAERNLSVRMSVDVEVVGVGERSVIAVR